MKTMRNIWLTSIVYIALFCDIKLATAQGISSLPPDIEHTQIEYILSNVIVQDASDESVSSDKYEYNSQMQSLLDRINFNFRLILPGTKWCGDGNSAATFHDLGVFRKTDLCCRTHDMCDDVIYSGQTAHNLTNSGFFSRLNCRCDAAFYKCLQDTQSPISTLVGYSYFNGLGGQCFGLNLPATCITTQLVDFRRRCTRYRFDWTEAPYYQWFDVPTFKTKRKS